MLQGCIRFVTVLAALAAGCASGAAGFRAVMTAGGESYELELLDNATAAALYAKLPLTLELSDLYGRELCCRFAEPLPAQEVELRGYEVGEIVYYPPRHSLVIMYRQNGERFGMQAVGRVTDGIGGLAGRGSVTVRLERAPDRAPAPL